MPAVHSFPLAATALVAIVGCRGAGGPKVTLRYHPPAGATYHYALDQQNVIRFPTGPGGSRPLEQSMAMHLYYTQLVHGAAGGGVAVTVTFDSTRVDAPGMTAPALLALDRMRGMRSDVVYDDRMQVRSAALSGAEGTPSAVSERIGAIVKSMALPLPDAPVGVGDAWVTEQELPMAQELGASAPVKARTTLTVKEIMVAAADTSVRFAVETRFPGDPVALRLQGQEATVRLSGRLSGEQVYSVSRGAQVRTAVGGTVTIEFRGGPAGEMTIVMTQQTALALTGAK